MVSLDVHITVRFTQKHLEIFWHSVGQHGDESHGLIGEYSCLAKVNSMHGDCNAESFPSHNIIMVIT